MASLLLSALILQASFGFAENADVGDYFAPGRADRMFEKRAPKDFGTYKVDCRNSESACNNACYLLQQAAQDPDANKIVFIGPNGNNGEDATNRVESGCQVNNPKEASPSVCGNFPFSQKFSNPTAGPGDNYQCDEWPPAMHQQPAFGKKKYPNSLRCMPGGENGSLGSKLMQYVNNKAGPHPGRPAGVMSMGDFFRVDFLSNIASADQKKVKFCLGIGTTNCGQDGMQFGLVAKPVGGGKISAPFNLNKNDNLYALQGTVYKEIYQCSVEFKRDGDKNIKDVKLLNWENSESQTTTGCTLANNGDTCDLKGLPNDLQIKRTGALGSKIEFEYAPGTQNTNVNNFAWDSETSGNGRGPWTDPASDPNRKPNRYCKVTRTGNTENTQCWFPCYKNRDGR